MLRLIVSHACDLPSHIGLRRLRETWQVREAPIWNDLDQDQTNDQPFENQETRDLRLPEVLDFHFACEESPHSSGASALTSYSFYPKYRTSSTSLCERDLLV